MTKEGPYQNRGGIESHQGARLNKPTVAAHRTGDLTVLAEDQAESEEARTLPLLFIGETTIRCNQFGNVRFSVIVPSPKSEDQGALLERWHHPESIFEAKDDFIEIIEAYSQGGVQYQRRLKAVRQTNIVGNRLQEGSLNEEERSALREQTITTMADAGYTSSVYPERVKTAKQLEKATELDILGRPNNPRGRMIASTRRPQLINDGLIAGDILKKNRRRLSVVEAVCDLIEQDFENIERLSSNLAKNQLGTGAFDAELPNFMRTVNYLLSYRNGVLPKPYSELGARIRYILFATDFATDVITLGKYMNLKDAIEFSDEFPCFNTLTEAKDRRDRILAVERLIKEGLEVLSKQRYAPVVTAEEKKAKKPAKLNAEQRLWREIEERYDKKTQGD